MAVLMFILPSMLGGLVLFAFAPDFWWLALLTLAAGLAAAAPLLALAYWFPTMRYEFRDDGLWLLYGPMFRYHLPTETITGAQWRDLGYAYFKTVRTPSLALGTIRYVDIGPVKMVATSPHKRVLVIDTTKGLYGVTPEDEAGFVAALPVSDPPIT